MVLWKIDPRLMNKNVEEVPMDIFPAPFASQK